MGVGVRKRPTCPYCWTLLPIQQGANVVKCPSCREVMEVTRFTQEERTLAAAVDKMSRSLQEAEVRMEEAMNEFARTGSAAAGEIHRQAEAQYSVLYDELERLRGEYENGQAKKLDGWFKLGEEAQRARRYKEAIKYYNNVLAVQSDEAEVHWRVLLCRYGVEYVRDQSTGIYLPTLTEMQVDDILQDEHYKAACEYARDEEMRAFYEQEGHKLDYILRRYQFISGSEKPYDVFISVKQGDDEGKVTSDARIGMNLYHTLREQGLRVFNSAESLVGKAGSEYEPYIMHALMSAKLMIVIASCESYINARWLKNEWRRFRYLRDSEGAQTTRRLIVYSTKVVQKGDTPLQIPQEIGAMQIIDAQSDAAPIEHLCGIAREMFPHYRSKDSEHQQALQAPMVQGTAPLLQRMFIELDDGVFTKANELSEDVLKIEPQNGHAYLGKLMIELQVRTAEELANQSQPFTDSINYKRIMRYGDDALKAQVQGYIRTINERNEYNRKKGILNNALAQLRRVQTVAQCEEARKTLLSIQGFEGFEEAVTACNARVEEINSGIYARAMNWKNQKQWQKAIDFFQTIVGFRDSREQISQCKEGILNSQYDAAMALKESKQWEKAIEAFRRIENYRDSKAQIAQCEEEILNDWYDAAMALKESKKWNEAIEAFRHIENHRDSKAQIAQCEEGILNDQYNAAIALKEDKQWDKALEAFMRIENYRDSKAQIAQCEEGILNDQYNAAIALKEGKQWDKAIEAFKLIENYRDSKAQIVQCREERASSYLKIIQNLRLATAPGSNIRRFDMIAAGGSHTIGLKSDGTVVAVGYNDKGRCNVSGWLNRWNGWTDIVAVAAGGSHTIGLKADGTLVSVGLNDSKQCNVSGWKNIVAVAAGWLHTVGLKADGTVVAVGANHDGQCDVSRWKDIVAVAAGAYRTVGLKADGTVVAVRRNYDGRCNVSGWKDIVAVATGYRYTVGLKADGTVVAVGNNYHNQCQVGDWKDIVAIAAGDSHTVGLKADGTVVAVGYNKDGRCNVTNWKLWD